MKRGILLLCVLLLLVMAFSSFAVIVSENACSEQAATPQNPAIDCEGVVGGLGLTGQCLQTGYCAIVEQCQVDADCSFCQETVNPNTGERLFKDCYCDLSSNTCAEIEIEVEEDVLEDPLAGVEEPAIVDIDVKAVETRLAGLLEQGLNQQAAILADLEVRITELEGRVDSQSTQLQSVSQLSAQVSTLKSKVDQAATKKDVNGALAGMATLEDDLSATQEEVAQVEQRVDKAEQFRSILIYLFFFLLIVAAGLGVYYYITRNKEPEVSSEVVNYITSHIKQGRKFPEIKANLLRAGWQEEQIQLAYKATMKNNYNSYLEQKGEKPASPSGIDKNKAAIFGIASVLIIVAIVFVMKGVGTGQAIGFAEFNDTVDGQEVRNYAVLCFAPHIPNGQNGCCLDENNNHVCDFRDELNANRPQQSAGECESNNQCRRSEMCVSGQCIDVSQLYSTNECAQTCTFDTVTVTTSDDEQYQVQEGQGGYTAAGGIEWRVSSGVEFCVNEQNIKVPIEVIKKNAGRIIEEEAVLLAQGERSDVIRHPNSPGVRFQLRVDRIKKECR